MSSDEAASTWVPQFGPKQTARFKMAAVWTVLAAAQLNAPKVIDVPAWVPPVFLRQEPVAWPVELAVLALAPVVGYTAVALYQWYVVPENPALLDDDF